ncbi:MAG TPA: gamma-glutamyltransferase, partial [Myxococcota bacterium]|nr:gamma-glutamyltransferase [Myxococcota bacterium]
LRTYGTRALADVMAPSIALARDGFDVSWALSDSLGLAAARLRRNPAAAAALLAPEGAAPVPGSRLVQPDLARTLARVRDRGRDGFYLGETARLVADDMRRNGGLITEADLAAYVAKERAPVRGSYRGYEIISMAPPSSGGVALVEMLNILEGYDLAAARRDTVRYVHLLAEAMRRAFVDRARHLADPDFASPPVARLTSKEYAARLRATIDTTRATVSEPAQVAERAESQETTRYSVVDASGMAVSVTYTLENGYGLGAVVPGAGFLLNNEMGDFNGKPGLTDTTGLIGTEPNLARPGKRMLSSMTPTIVAKDGRLFAVVGTPGGRTIINTVLQVVLNLIDGGMPIEAAVRAPRLHHQWLPDRISTERDALSPATVAALERMGHRVRSGGGQGTAHSIAIDARTGARRGAPDRRDPDAGAAGY